MLPLSNRVNYRRTPHCQWWHWLMMMAAGINAVVIFSRYRLAGSAAHLMPGFRQGFPSIRCGRHLCAKASTGVSVAWVDDHRVVANDYDGILVLGGGFTSDGTLNTWSQRRLDASVDLQKLQVKPCPIVCLGGGTPHRPPVIDSNGYPIHEATICANYLLESSVHPDLILKEISSYDTVGNVYFGLTIHALPAQWKKLAVVTSDFHMPRAIALFQDMLRLAAKDYSIRFSADYFPVSDTGIFPPKVLERRKAKETQSINTWKEDVKNIASLRDLHAWLHRTHFCYSVARQSELADGVADDNEIKQTY